MELFLSQFKLEKRKKISNNIYNWYFQTTYLYLTFSDNKQNFWLIKFFRNYQVLYHHASKLLTHQHAHGYHAIKCSENCEERDDVFYLLSHTWERQYPLLLNILRKTLRRSADGVNKKEYFFYPSLVFSSVVYSALTCFNSFTFLSLCPHDSDKSTLKKFANLIHLPWIKDFL